jgi:hypothetical protein
MLTEIKLNSNTGYLIRNTLRIETSKNRWTKQLETTASVCSFDKDLGLLQFVMFTDYLKTIASSNNRATKKAISEQHQKALRSLSMIMIGATAHYRQKNIHLEIKESVIKQFCEEI